MVNATTPCSNLSGVKYASKHIICRTITGELHDESAMVQYFRAFCCGQSLLTRGLAQQSNLNLNHNPPKWQPFE
jgi:hypothetical protein